MEGLGGNGVPMYKRKHTAATGLGLVLAVALSGCSTKGDDDSGSSAGSDGVKTGPGITDTEITLGALTDSSGPFKVGGVLVTHGNELWAKEVNEQGGICGRKIKLDIRDTAYKADQAVPLYDQLQTEAAGMIQIIGSAVFAAIKQKMVADQFMGSSPTIASSNLDTDVMVPVTTTFDVEAINGLAYLQGEGLIADGDKIGAIYMQNEAGENSFLGVQAYAKDHDLEVVGSPISPTDTDMTSTVTKMKSEGVKAVFVAVPPAATASTGVQMKNQGLAVPLLGFNSAFQPSVLSDPGVTAALQENFYFIPAARTWNSDAEGVAKLREAYTAAGITDAPAQSVITGYLSGLAWGAILEQACDDGDLTRAGLIEAKKKVTKLDTNGLSGTLDFSDPAAPPTRETLIARVDPAAPGGLKEISKLTVSDEAKDYKTPHQD